MTPGLRVLITAYDLAVRRGVPMVTRDLAIGLAAAGHKPVLYTQAAGEIAAELRELGFEVEERADVLEGPFDIIHGNHLSVCAEVLARFPKTPAVFVCHDNETYFDAAPVLPNVTAYAAVSQSLAQRVAEDAGVPTDRVALMLNSVDTERFKPGPRPANPPRRALAFAKNEDHVQIVRAVCTRLSIELDVVGASAVVVKDPARVVPDYDLVFASALSALEAMACLRPVIVCDGRGLAGMVDAERYEQWRPQNFGFAILSAPLSVEQMLAEMDRYDPDQARDVGLRVRAEAARGPWIARHVDFYRAAMAVAMPDGEVSARMWARHLQRWSPRSPDHAGAVIERQHLVNLLRRRRYGLDVLPRNHRFAFGRDGAFDRFIDTAGFENLERDVIWTAGRFASLRFHLGEAENALSAALDYSVHLPARAFALEIEILLNGAPIERWRHEGGEGWLRCSRRISLPMDLCHPGISWLTFRLAQAAGPPPPHAPAFGLHSIAFSDDR